MREKLLKDYYDEQSLAKELGITIRSLRRWRKERRGPPPTVIGRKVVYSATSVRSWIASNEKPMVRSRSRRQAEATAA